MWSKFVEMMNPYEYLVTHNKNKANNRHNNKNIVFTSGKNIYDFFIIPTIRVNSDLDITFVTIEWLKWFIGFKFYTK